MSTTTSAADLRPAGSTRTAATRAFALYETTIGKKIVMAASGVVWFGYVIGHLLGNLQIYGDPGRINAYSEFLHATPVILWGTRVVLLAALVAHVVASTQLTLRNYEARKTPYARRDDVATTYAARTMVWSGPLLLLFILYHLAHLTAGVAPGTPYDPHHVYNNVVRGFQIPWIAAFYIVCQVALAMHLYHGAWSFFQTLGVNHPRYNHYRRNFAAVMTALIFAGYVSIPVAVMTGVLRPVEPAAEASHD
jgi:succinate dehydrogenase / fumarate reductase, cytochrome b subunit